MKKRLLLIIITLLMSNYSLSKSNYIIIDSADGLRIRKGPGLNFNKTDVIPNNSLLTFSEINKKVDIINGKTGNWIKISWGKQTGWIFNAYTKSVPDWVYSIESFWMLPVRKSDSTGFSINKIASGGSCYFVGCPGGYSAFDIVGSVVNIEEKKILLKLKSIELYEGDVAKESTMEIKYLDDNKIFVDKEVFIKSKKSKCVDE
jgi:hypothetical protein